MLTADEERRLEDIVQRLEPPASEDPIERNRGVHEAWRAALHLYEDVVRRATRGGLALTGAGFERLRELAARAIDTLGSQAEPSAASLKDYDHRRYGPYLGVSDDGKAVDQIRDAMLNSPKIRALGPSDPIVVGGAHDAERLGAVGEVPIGPAGYRDIRLGCIGRILTSTDIGTRLNLRYYEDAPLLELRAGLDPGVAAAKAAELLAPFRNTPDENPRPVTLFATFAGDVSHDERARWLRALRDALCSGRYADPARHRLGLLARVGPADAVAQTEVAIDLCAGAGLAEVAVEGVVRDEAERHVSLPGLLEFFDAAQANRLLARARDAGLPLHPWRRVDTDTVARNVWPALLAARNMGLELGKYGLLPLTVEEGAEVIRCVQSWLGTWSAAPAIYVDAPTVTVSRVYEEPDAAEGVTAWLDTAARHGVRLVLIDTADKAKGRRVLKDGPDDPVGILSLDQVTDLDRHAAERGIHVLWAGGLSAAQAYEMGRMGAFGIYTTTSTAVEVAVFGDYVHDPALASVKEPTFLGVYRVKLLLEAGFLVQRLLAAGERSRADAIDGAAQTLRRALDAAEDEAAVWRAVEALEPLGTEGWRIVLAPAERGG